MLNGNEKVVRPSKVKKATREFINNYLTSTQEIFEETMEEVRLCDPKLWAKLYVDMSKLVIPKQTNVNVNVGINKDYRELHMLATTKVGENHRLEKMTPIEDVDYEEITDEYQQQFD